MDKTYVDRIKDGLRSLQRAQCYRIVKREKVDASKYVLLIDHSHFDVVAFDDFIRFACSSFSFDFLYECSFQVVYNICCGFVIANCESCFHSLL